MSDTNQRSLLPPPKNLELPLFVYGALKPRMPAFHHLSANVLRHEKDGVKGDLFVRDGLPLLATDGCGRVDGYRLHWKPQREFEGYEAVCLFEPRKHYKWEEVRLESGTEANILVMGYPKKGNPQFTEKTSWQLTDDPAFGPGLEAVSDMVNEINAMPFSDLNWPRFFRSQMAYLLLWSILERLSALCLGPGQEPMQRVNRLHELPGMGELVRQSVTRADRVSDSRDPSCVYELNGENAKKSFQYYYQVRSNLSHRGKAMVNDFDKVNQSLVELLEITRQYLDQLSGRTVE